MQAALNKVAASDVDSSISIRIRSAASELPAVEQALAALAVANASFRRSAIIGTIWLIAESIISLLIRIPSVRRIDASFGSEVERIKSNLLAYPALCTPNRPRCSADRQQGAREVGKNDKVIRLTISFASICSLWRLTAVKTSGESKCCRLLVQIDQHTIETSIARAILPAWIKQRLSARSVAR